MTLCHVRYGLVLALRGVSRHVDAGAMVALLGANGAGKTTTLRAISGLIHPHAGELRPTASASTTCLPRKWFGGVSPICPKAAICSPNSL